MDRDLVMGDADLTLDNATSFVDREPNSCVQSLLPGSRARGCWLSETLGPAECRAASLSLAASPH